MDIIHKMDDHLLPRHVQGTLSDHLRVMPAVVISGARQTGKSTLARELTPGRRRFRSLDDLDVADLARHDPDALVSGSTPLTIDEVQRDPDLLRAVKRAIDRDRRVGQFLLTGSANLLMMRKVSESLAGRAGYVTLWPMTRREQLGMGRCGLWQELLDTGESDWVDLIKTHEPIPDDDWRALARRGGFPTPAIELGSDSDRAVWFAGYVKTYLERDLQTLSSISALSDFRRLVRAVCLRLGQISNQTELGRDVSLPQPTVHRYLNLLETSFLLVRLPAYSVNRTKRLIKSPKMYWCDTGLAMHIAGERKPTGAHLENVVLADLLCWRDAAPQGAEIAYWRTTTGEEVDLVVEAAGSLLPIEIKSTKRPRLSDISSLRAFRSEYGNACRAGVLLHDGSELEWMTEDVLAAPWWSIV